MTRRRQQVLSAAVAGACLTLCACGAGSRPSAASSAAAATSASAELTARFCANASSFMRQIPAAPATGHLSTALARDNLRQVLRATVQGFAQLEAEAPSRLRGPLATIVGGYQSDERAAAASGSLARISQSMVKGNAASSAAFQQVLTYIGANCR